MNITGSFYTRKDDDKPFEEGNGAFSIDESNIDDAANFNYGTYSKPLSGGIKFDASKSWTGTTSSASPQTSALGSGQALDITPAYYSCHMWLRTS